VCFQGAHISESYCVHPLPTIRQATATSPDAFLPCPDGPFLAPARNQDP
jgi:hypothetical protein